MVSGLGSSTTITTTSDTTVTADPSETTRVTSATLQTIYFETTRTTTTTANGILVAPPSVVQEAVEKREKKESDVNIALILLPERVRHLRELPDVVQKRNYILEQIFKLNSGEALISYNSILNNVDSWTKEAKQAESLISKKIELIVSHPRVPRTLNLDVTPEGEILIHLYRVGRGSSKWVDLAFEFMGGTALAHAKTQTSPLFDLECKAMSQFSGKEGIAQVRRITYERNSKISGLLMDYCEGGTLAQVSMKNADVVKQTAAEYRQKVDWAISLMKGLSEIHAKGLIHNDIKPANVFLGNGQMVVGDLGQLTGSSRECILGTPDYFPPEILVIFFNRFALSQYDAKRSSERLAKAAKDLEERQKSRIRSLGPPKDIWSMGLTLYHLFFYHKNGFYPPPTFPMRYSIFQNGFPIALREGGLEEFRKNHTAFMQHLEALSKEVPSHREIIRLIERMILWERSERIQARDVLAELERIRKTL